MGWDVGMMCWMVVVGEEVTLLWMSHISKQKKITKNKKKHTINPNNVLASFGWLRWWRSRERQ